MGEEWTCLAEVSVCVGMKGKELLSPDWCGVPQGVAQGVEARHCYGPRGAGVPKRGSRSGMEEGEEVKEACECLRKNGSALRRTVEMEREINRRIETYKKRKTKEHQDIQQNEVE